MPRLISERLCVSRPVFTYPATWLDKHFRKTFEKLAPAEREERVRQLVELTEALKACVHPVRDPRLQPFRPTSYRGVTQIPGGQLIEYRFPGTMRVIACYFEAGSEARPSEHVVLMTVTLSHDHDRMKRLIQQHRPGVGKEWE